MKLTPTQQRIYDVLADGAAHPRSELIPCLWDDQSENPAAALYEHISNMRKALSRRGLDIISRGVNGTSFYRLVRYVSAGE